MAEQTKMEDTFISSLSFHGSEEEVSVFCKPCDRDGPRLHAHGYCTDCKEHLCESCFKHHRRHSLSRHHKLINKYNMPQSQRLPSSMIYTSSSDSLQKPCQKHKKETIKFFCHDHNTLLCCVCVTLDHTTTTCQINYIPEISGQIINSKNYQDYLKAVDIIVDKCKQLTDEARKMTEKSNASLIGLMTDIQKFRIEINHRIDELERQSEDTAKVIQQENDKNLKTLETACEDIAKSLKKLTDSIKDLNASKQSEKLFVELKRSEQVIKSKQDMIEKLAEMPFEEYSFNPSEEITSMLENENSLGTLFQKTLEPECLPPKCNVKQRKISHQGEICVKAPEEKHMCWVTGMILLNPNILVLTDHDNNTLKLVDIRTKSISDKIQLDVSPMDVTAVTSYKLAVTLPKLQTVQFLSAVCDKLKKADTLKVDGQCQGISFFEDKLVVSFGEPAKIEIIDINGTKLVSVLGRHIFSCPEYVTANTHGIYISDWDMKKVTRLNWQGDVIGGYGGIVEPCGIALSDEGNVFVGDNSRHVIQEISGDCSEGIVILRDVKCARAVCWCSGKSILYFSSELAGKSNFVQMYKLS